MEVVVPCAREVGVGVGLGWKRGGIGLVAVQWVGERSGGRVVIPVWQPMAQPFAPEWQGIFVLPGWQDVGVQVAIDWIPGSAPGLRWWAHHRAMEVGLGSDGAWLAWSAPGGRGRWRCSIGVMRGNVPWSGVDWGVAHGLGSDPGGWRPFRGWGS